LEMPADMGIGSDIGLGWGSGLVWRAVQRLCRPCTSRALHSSMQQAQPDSIIRKLKRLPLDNLTISGTSNHTSTLVLSLHSANCYLHGFLEDGLAMERLHPWWHLGTRAAGMGLHFAHIVGH